MKKPALLTALVYALLLTPALGLAEIATESAAPAAKQPEAQIVSENTKLDMGLYEGKAVYLNFFTEWCPYCMDEMPEIKRIFEEYDPEKLQIILVHVWDGEDASNSESIRKKYGLEDMTFFEDEDTMLSQVIGLSAYPTSLFFDAEGYLVMGHEGGVTYDDLVKVMKELGVPEKENK